MIKTHEQIRLKDENKEFDLIFEVNWDKNDERSNDCKLVKVLYHDGTSAVIKREELHSFLFSIATPEEQTKLIPIKKTRTKHWETVITVKAKKDIREGDDITFPLKLTIPVEEEETLQQ